MSRIIICDRCGGEITTKDEIGCISVRRKTEEGEPFNSNPFEEWDFCAECTERIVEFVKSGKPAKKKRGQKMKPAGRKPAAAGGPASEKTAAPGNTGKNTAKDTPAAAQEPATVQVQTEQAEPAGGTKNTAEKAPGPAAAKEPEKKLKGASIKKKKAKKDDGSAELDIGKVFALANAGWPEKEIAAEMGCDTEVIKAALYSNKGADFANP